MLDPVQLRKLMGLSCNLTQAHITAFAEILTGQLRIHSELGKDTLWWRGEVEACWDLLPKVFRCNPEGRRLFLSKDEASMIIRFKEYAPARYANCPQTSSKHEWLFLAQHYGLPTRLLDWSRFACRDSLRSRA
ncbi:MAG: FRG domain-containing protein [Acidobacteria bacterium]|nr:FRG domain-containing protein [Acidobacteriota bacterium]